MQGHFDIIKAILFKKRRCHFAEYPAPGQELVCGSFGDIGLGIDTCCSEVSCGLVDSIGILLAAATDENAPHLVRVLDILRRI